MIERISLDAADAVEIIDVFEMFCDWFDHDRARLDDSLWKFTAGGLRLAALRDDLRRFIDLVGHAPVTNSGPR